MKRKQNSITKICLTFLMTTAALTVLAGCGSNSNSAPVVKNGPVQNVQNNSSTDKSQGSDASSKANSNSNGNGSASGSDPNASGKDTSSSNSTGSSDSSNSNANGNSGPTSSNNSISGSNGVTTQAPQGKDIAFDAVTDLNSLPPQTKAMVNLHKTDNGTFRSDENGSTYILIGSGQAPSEGFTLRAEKVTENADNITVTTSEYKPGSTAPAVPYVVVKIKQTDKPVQAYNLGYIK